MTRSRSAAGSAGKDRGQSEKREIRRKERQTIEAVENARLVGTARSASRSTACCQRIVRKGFPNAVKHCVGEERGDLTDFIRTEGDLGECRTWYGGR